MFRRSAGHLVLKLQPATSADDERNSAHARLNYHFRIHRRCRLTTGGVAAAQQAPATDTTVTTGSAPTGSLDVPAPDTTVSPINRPLLITGVLLLGGTYGASVIDAAASGRDADKNNLNYPVVGPWMDYANRGGCPASGSCASEIGNKTLLILDGVGQGLGAIGMVASLFLPEKSTRN